MRDKKAQVLTANFRAIYNEEKAAWAEAARLESAAGYAAVEEEIAEEFTQACYNEFGRIKDKLKIAHDNAQRAAAKATQVTKSRKVAEAEVAKALDRAGQLHEDAVEARQAAFQAA